MAEQCFEILLIVVNNINNIVEPESGVTMLDNFVNSIEK